MRYRLTAVCTRGRASDRCGVLSGATTVGRRSGLLSRPRSCDPAAALSPGIRTLALLTRFRGAERGANDHRHRATSGHIQPLPLRLLEVMLALIAAGLAATDGRPLSDPELVAECEQVISVQNQAWMAKWGDEDVVSAAAD